LDNRKRIMNKIEKAVLKTDPSIKELSKIISDIVIEHYGEHNYEYFKAYINDALIKTK